jgi:glycosyltransferase involved in cell wall biosynthesis
MTEADPVRPRVIFINRFFYPDHSATSQMLSDLAFGLAERELSVSVITSRFRYDACDEQLSRSETHSGVKIERVWTSRFGRGRLVFRSIDYLTFYLAAAWALLRTARRGDVVVAMTDPPMLSVIITPIAKLRGARVVNWLQDTFPEVAQALGVGGSIAVVPFALLRWVRNASLRRADMNIAIGELVAGRLARIGLKASRIRVVPNWADCGAIKPLARTENRLRTTWNISQDFVVGYSGNLGRAHEIETLLDAIRIIEEGNRGASATPAIRWLFIGGGLLFDRMKREATERGLKSVQFRGYQPREHLSESLSAADVHIVSLRPELEGLIVPSKFYGVAAAGRATLFIGSADGEIARLIFRHECGVVVAPGDGAGLARAVTGLARDLVRCQSMGKRARAMCEAFYSKGRGVDAWQDMLGTLTSADMKLTETLPHAESESLRA